MTIEEARNKLIDMLAEMCAYYCNGKPLECQNCDLCEEREAFMMADKALENAERYRWHDLRKDPQDLPKTKGSAYIPCMVMIDGCGSPEYAEYEFYAGYGWGFIGYRPESIIAWREAELFEVDE